MGLYERHVLPWILHVAMQNPEATRYREKVVPRARGRVLELGIGSGLNLPYYGHDVSEVVGVDPSPRLLALAAGRSDDLSCALSLVEDRAEELPFDDASFDTVVSTWTLCSVDGLDAALGEVRRVLRADGAFHFIEHGLSREPAVARRQARWTPAWRRIAGGCRLDRDMAAALRAAGFRIANLDTGYLVRGPRVLTWHYQGWAHPSPAAAEAAR